MSLCLPVCPAAKKPAEITVFPQISAVNRVQAFLLPASTYLQSEVNRHTQYNTQAMGRINNRPQLPTPAIGSWERGPCGRLICEKYIIETFSAVGNKSQGMSLVSLVTRQ